jgi:hypothetical protein
MIVMADTLDARVQAAADEIIRLVAPDECPAWSPTLAMTFDEIGMDDERIANILGVSATRLDNYVAWKFSRSLAMGRPIFAINPPAIIRYTQTDECGALMKARDTAVHELAHAVYRPYPATINDPATYIDRVLKELTDGSTDKRSHDDHDRLWWRTYTLLVARMFTAAPELSPLGYYAFAARQYGYCPNGDDHSVLTDNAAKWVVAAQFTPDYMTGPIAEVAARSCPRFDALLDQFRPASTSPPAVAASPF